MEIKCKCTRCKGTGEIDEIDDGTPVVITCPDCEGEGLIDWADIGGAIETKIDSIIAEQASQREDLTNGLSQIWDKVKDL